MGKPSFKLSHMISYLAIFALGFYTILFCLNYYNKKNGLLKTIAALLTTFFILSLLANAYTYFLLPTLGVQLYKSHGFNLKIFIQNVLSYYVRFFVFALLYFIIRNYYKKETERVKLEYAFLRSQINPHFLYNTLNTIYSQAQPLSDDLADNIQKLSGMMRYSLENATQMNGIINIRQELKYLQAYIDIHQVRFQNTLQIVFNVKGEPGDQHIPPLSLITVVENAFKFGELRDSNNPVIIKILLEFDRLEFYCANKKKQKPTSNNSSHIGIKNLQSRLDFGFKGKYRIKAYNQPDDYIFHLTIQY